MPVTRAMNASIDWSEYIENFLSDGVHFVDFGGRIREPLRFELAESKIFSQALENAMSQRVQSRHRGLAERLRRLPSQSS